MIAAWVLFPLVGLAVCLGSGLLVDRLSGGAVPGALLGPVGLAATILVAAACTTWPLLAPAATPVVAGVALVGWVVGAGRLRRRGRWRREHAWPALAGAVAFAVIAAPVVLSGAPTFTGATRIVDIAHQLELTAHLVTDGRTLIDPIVSSFDESIDKLVPVGYPGGAQSALGALAGLVGQDVMWVYQPFLALLGAGVALALYALLGAAIPGRAARALAAGVAAQANLLYAYGLEGGIKELATTAMLALAAALLVARPPSVTPPRALVPAAVALAGAFAAFSLTVAPWLGLLGAGLLGLDLAARRRPRAALVGWAALGGMVLVASVPTVISSLKLVGTVAGASKFVDLGNLAAPLPFRAAAGVWLTADYRYPVTTYRGLTDAAIVAVALLALVGVVAAVRRRLGGLVVVGVVMALALAYVVRGTGPWIELKAFAITGPFCLAFAFMGAGALGAGGRRRVLGWGLALALAGVTVLGNALTYRNLTYAPSDRYRDLERLGLRYAGAGPALFPSFDENAEYLLRRAQAVGIVDPPGKTVRVRGDARRVRGQPFKHDLDDLEPAFVQRFRLIVVRRDPTASRPPGNYALAERTRFFEVWRRRGDAPRGTLHVPFDGQAPPAGQRGCGEVARAARAAGAGARVAVAGAPELAVFQPLSGTRPRSWRVRGSALAPAGPGRVEGSVTVPETGRWSLWLEGSTGRGVEVRVDGQRVGAVRHRYNYPRAFEWVGERALAVGPHAVTLRRGGGGLRPGTGDATGELIGALVLAREDRPAGPVQTVPASAAGAVCRRPGLIDWVEVTPARS